VGASYCLNPLCFSLAGGLFFVCFYSLTKRFTDFTHVFPGRGAGSGADGGVAGGDGKFSTLPVRHGWRTMQYSAVLPIVAGGGRGILA
jgi:4-hydroxybenzoate polyprenyltransferase